MGPAPTDLPTTATMAALFTAQAEMNLLTTTPVATALPDTGFADNYSIPALISLAAALVVIIFLARRLRTAG
jgi:LPXTG-motif cell wall-anchored protein